MKTVFKILILFMLFVLWGCDPIRAEEEPKGPTFKSEKDCEIGECSLWRIETLNGRWRTWYVICPAGKTVVQFR
jgi:hypothetical protein